MTASDSELGAEVPAGAFKIKDNHYEVKTEKQTVENDLLYICSKW